MLPVGAVRILVLGCAVIAACLAGCDARCDVTPNESGDVVIAAGTTSIAAEAYFGCRQLVSIGIADTVTSIGSSVR